MKIKKNHLKTKEETFLGRLNSHTMIENVDKCQNAYFI